MNVINTINRISSFQVLQLRATVIILITECDDLHWGENCQGSCIACGNVKECNKTHGCICQDGYRGDLCNQNINECNETNVSQNCTELNEVCVDTIGSYVCQCLDGYERNDTDHCGKIFLSYGPLKDSLQTLRDL